MDQQHRLFILLPSVGTVVMKGDLVSTRHIYQNAIRGVLRHTAGPVESRQGLQMPAKKQRVRAKSQLMGGVQIGFRGIHGGDCSHQGTVNKRNVNDAQS
jgi:hypothetical protein